MPLVKVRDRGQLTIPASIRRDLRMEAETTLTIEKVGGVILLAPHTLDVDAVGRKAEREMKKAGLGLDELLAELNRQRRRYARERHGA